jgi:DNA/RNA-binding domain of Phe-tRNA-synthetase-like protein
MYFEHSADIWTRFPELVPGVVTVAGLTNDAAVADPVARFAEVATERLAVGSEGEFPEIQAWRRAFSKMGLKPTQYRCASESLLRRFRKEHELPSIHPVIDLCNAISLAYAVPIAVFDVAHVTGGLTVRPATGDERYLTFGGDTEHPEPGEVIFADEVGNAHARRWTNRQSRLSAVSDTTTSVLIVTEAMHATAATDVPKLVDTLADEFTAVWSSAVDSTVLSADTPRYELPA